MKWLKWALGLLVISVATVFLIDEKMINEAERNSGFKQSEWGLYRFYVDEDIKMRRVLRMIITFAFAGWTALLLKSAGLSLMAQRKRRH